jgi:hypothetical protein
MITLTTQMKPHPDVIATKLANDEIVLLHLQTQQYYTLNQTGATIWLGLTDAQPLTVIGQELEAHYDIPLPQAQAHVATFVVGLAAEQLVQSVELG